MRCLRDGDRDGASVAIGVSKVDRQCDECFRSKVLNVLVEETHLRPAVGVGVGAKSVFAFDDGAVPLY